MMKKSHEKLLIATLAGLVIAATAAFVVSPALAGFSPAPAKIIVLVS
jgi:hypothetical protein